jgi:Flp pilus assembly protein TadD
MNNVKKIVAILVLACLFFVCAFAQETRKVTLAVLPFSTSVLSDSPGGFAAFGELFAGNFTTLLAEFPSIRLLERSMLDPVLAELAMQRDSDSFFDDATVAQRAKLLLTDFIMHGNAIVADPNGSDVRINVKMMDKNTGRIVFSKQLRGAAAELFDNCDDYIAMALVAMKARLSEEEETRTFPKGRALYQALLLEGTLSERIAALEAAVLADSEVLEGWKVLANLYRESGDTANAYTAVKRLVIARPSDLESTFFLAALAFECGQGKEAEIYFRLCEKNAFRRVESLYHMGLIKELGASGQKFGPGSDIAAAQTHYRAALKLEPRHAPSLYNLAYSYFVLASREAKPNKLQYECIKAEVEFFLRYVECAPEEDALRVATVREQVEQHKLFLAAWEKANK